MAHGSKFAVNNSLSAITTLPSSISGGALNLISTQTASASASISFTSGIDSTYDSYVFKFINIHPAAQEIYRFKHQLWWKFKLWCNCYYNNFRFISCMKEVLILL
jgi:hypothetical protein